MRAYYLPRAGSLIGANVADVVLNYYKTRTNSCVVSRSRSVLSPFSSEIVLQEVGTKPNCVTEHPGFGQVCLQRWSLRLAADKYKTKDKAKYRQTGSENRYKILSAFLIFRLRL